MIATGSRRIELDMKELKDYLAKARPAVGEEGYEKLTAAIETLAYQGHHHQQTA